MSTTDASSETGTLTPAPATIDMKLEVVNLPEGSAVGLGHAKPVPATAGAK